MRKRIFMIMLLPLIIILWTIGWTLFWTGTKTQPKTSRPTESKSDEIEITIVPPEEITAQID